MAEPRNATIVTLSQFNRFLSSVDLAGLRKKYKNIKIIELDMPKNVQALDCIYSQYWKKKEKWAGYDEFYGVYKTTLSAELDQWRIECQFSKETFYRGLPARIYRTWASLLTQIQGAYVAETIYGCGNVDMGVRIDQSGRDMVIDLGDKIGRMPIQIKKGSYRPEAQRKTRPKHKFIKVIYEVPTSSPLTKTGKKSMAYERWREKWGDKLERLDNGFIVFKPKMFEAKELLAGIIE